MIKSQVGRGAIFAGDTPLASTIAVEQTGPMQLTVRAGSFTSTGQARIRTYHAAGHQALIQSGDAERLPDGQRVRLWINGQKAQTYTLAADQIIDLTSDPLASVAYDVDLISDGATTDVLVKRKIVGAEAYGEAPAGWQKIHELVFEFILPAGCADVSPLAIYALTITPGFPEGTGPDDWATQTGGV